MATEVTTGTAGHRRRLTQPERSAATQQALLDSTIECLIELGYDRSTTGEVSERAGLSRGAHLHHFQTRAALLAAATESLAQRGGAELDEMTARLPQGAKRTAAALDMLWTLFTGQLFQAMLELAIHARTDPELQSHLAPVEEMVGRETVAVLRHAFGFDPSDRRADPLLDMVLATVRGLAVLPLFAPDTDLDRRWKFCRAQLIKVLDGAS